MKINALIKITGYIAIIEFITITSLISTQYNINNQSAFDVLIYTSQSKTPIRAFRNQILTKQSMCGNITLYMTDASGNTIKDSFGKDIGKTVTLNCQSSSTLDLFIMNGENYGITTKVVDNQRPVSIASVSSAVTKKALEDQEKAKQIVQKTLQGKAPQDNTQTGGPASAPAPSPAPAPAPKPVPVIAQTAAPENNITSTAATPTNTSDGK